jgi:hypothetical protein
VRFGNGRAIDVFERGANGCAKPTRTISDSGALAVEGNNVLYVANGTTATVDIFGAGSSTPEAQIGASKTGLPDPSSLTLDAAHNVYVFDVTTESIREFVAGARGNVAPIRTISGASTGLVGALGLAVGNPPRCAVCAKGARRPSMRLRTA